MAHATSRPPGLNSFENIIMAGQYRQALLPDTIQEFFNSHKQQAAIAQTKELTPCSLSNC